MEHRADLLEVSAHFDGRFVKILMCPEDWDLMFGNGFAYIDETNQERAVEVQPNSPSVKIRIGPDSRPLNPGTLIQVSGKYVCGHNDIYDLGFTPEQVKKQPSFLTHQ